VGAIVKSETPAVRQSVVTEQVVLIDDFAAIPALLNIVSLVEYLEERGVAVDNQRPERRLMVYQTKAEFGALAFFCEMYDLQLGGGGARSRWYRKAIGGTAMRWAEKESLRKGFSPQEVPISDQLELHGAEIEHRYRFSIAYGQKDIHACLDDLFAELTKFYLSKATLKIIMGFI
jgi:hypothetical protein